MVVAGDHANNDMAGDDDDSWKSMFNASGKFDSVDTQIAGLGSIADIEKIYVQHTTDAINQQERQHNKYIGSFANFPTEVVQPTWHTVYFPEKI